MYVYICICKYVYVYIHIYIYVNIYSGVQDAVVAKQIKYIRIDGSVPPAKRALAVEEFQKSPDGKMVAILGITAAGTGLTLTAASTVVFVELSWTPGLMVQAEDRVHRIGQHNACNIHYLLAADSCDSHMWPSLVKKLRVVSQICDGSVQAHHSLKGWTPDSNTLAPPLKRGASLAAPDWGGSEVTLLGAEETMRAGQCDILSSLFPSSAASRASTQGWQPNKPSLPCNKPPLLQTNKAPQPSKPVLVPQPLKARAAGWNEGSNDEATSQQASASNHAPTSLLPGLQASAPTSAPSGSMCGVADVPQIDLQCRKHRRPFQNF